MFRAQYQSACSAAGVEPNARILEAGTVSSAAGESQLSNSTNGHAGDHKNGAVPVPLLDASGEGIGDDGGAALCVALPELPELRSLDLWSNDLGPGFARALATAFQAPTCHISTLQLKYNRLGDTGAASIATILSSSKTLTALDLEKNGIGMDGARAIADQLTGPDAAPLASLHMGNNALGDNTMYVFATMLRRNTTLRTLNLSFTGASDVGAAVLGVALNSNRTLTELFILGNAITEEYEAPLAMATRRNRGDAVATPLGKERPITGRLPAHDLNRSALNSGTAREVPAVEGTRSKVAALIAELSKYPELARYDIRALAPHSQHRAAKANNNKSTTSKDNAAKDDNKGKDKDNTGTSARVVHANAMGSLWSDGFSRLFFAIDKHTGDQVVLKVLESARRYQHELSMLNFLASDHVVKVLDYGTLRASHRTKEAEAAVAKQDLSTTASTIHNTSTNGGANSTAGPAAADLQFIVMERAFEDLRDVITHNNVIPCNMEACAMSLAGIVRHLQEKRIVHCRLRPEAFMRFGKRWKLVDIDHCVFSGNPIDLTAQPKVYSAPEHARHRLSDSTDLFRAEIPSMLWSLGVVVAELYTPMIFEGVDEDLVLRHYANSTFGKSTEMISDPHVAVLLQNLLADKEADRKVVMKLHV